MGKKIFPSLLSANLMYLADELHKLQDAGIDTVHFDVMDNHYVPNLTFGPLLCEAIHKEFPQLNIDVHLMVKPVDSLIKAFANAGATKISIHPDASLHLDRSLELIAACGCEVGLALNPAASIESLQWVSHRLNFVLVMTVNPGFGGQSLIKEVIPKIKQIKKLYPNLTIAVDGGIQIGNIQELAQAGASWFVAGTAIFSSSNIENTIRQMQTAISAHAIN